MSTPTAARPTARKDSHWYTPTGEPRYELMGKTTGKPKSVTLRDARELNLVPSVTTILKILHKEALVNWLIEQSVLACLTAPRLKIKGPDGKEMEEPADAFVERVLHVERQQDQESTIARDKGTEIHGALEDYFTGVEIETALREWILPAAQKLQTYGSLVASEKILVGDGYAGKTDLILEAPDCWWIWDYKSTKKLPDPKKGGAWSEHRLQLSAYAQAYEDILAAGGAANKPIRTGNLYISSLEPGAFVVCEHDEWASTYAEGFAPLVTHWQWANKYRPKMPERMPKLGALPRNSVVAAQDEPPTAEAPAPEPQRPPPAQAAKPAANAIQLKDGKHVVWTPGVVARSTPRQ